MEEVVISIFWSTHVRASYPFDRSQGLLQIKRLGEEKPFQKARAFLFHSSVMNKEFALVSERPNLFSASSAAIDLHVFVNACSCIHTSQKLFPRVPHDSIQ